MPRGGKRPGAGAPRGNLNALRTGKHGVYPERCGSSSRRAQYKRLLRPAHPEALEGSRDQEALRLLDEIALGDQKRAERRRCGVYPEPGASRSRRAMQVLAKLLKQQEMRALDRTIDEWERRRNTCPPLEDPHLNPRPPRFFELSAPQRQEKEDHRC